jgi:hypothetical protein
LDDFTALELNTIVRMNVATRFLKEYANPRPKRVLSDQIQRTGTIANRMMTIATIVIMFIEVCVVGM